MQDVPELLATLLKIMLQRTMSIFLTIEMDLTFLTCGSLNGVGEVSEIADR